MNIISAVKLVILLFIVITGFVVLGGGTSVEDPRANFRNSFDGITHNGNDIVNALVSINFAYQGYSNAFNVVNEIKVRSYGHIIFLRSNGTNHRSRIHSTRSNWLHPSPS